MPSASDAQRALMQQWFGDEIDETGPYNFLKSRGWIEKEGMFFKPTPSYNPGVAEVECVLFLRNEWDYDFAHPLFPQSISGAF